jgi:hypothetical protein
VLAALAMAQFDYLQRILGTDKKNQIFSVFEHSLTKDYHVYYGAELFDIVPSDREDTRFKLMIAHLANIGIALAKLQATFKLDPRTIKKWSRALRSGDAEVLARAFAGRNASRKLTRAVEEYVRIRFPSIYSEDRYTYSSKIRRELKKALRIELSAEALRPLFNKLKAELEQHEGEACAPAQEGNQDKDGDEDEDEEDGEPPAPGGSGDSEPEAQYPVEETGSGSQSSIELTTYSESEFLKAPQILVEPLRALNEEDRSVPKNRKAHADFSTARWCSHLGLLLFSEPLSALEDVLGADKGPPVIQWASQVLLGAANLEQTKLLSAADLSLLLGGEPAGTPGHQRKKLAALAEDPALARDILRWNFQRVGGPTMSDFYFDPHTKHYTGKKNVLKGWCSKIRWADKVLQGDFIHSTSGQPLYLENTDSYEDMRQRFMQSEERFRDCMDIGQERVLTWIIDRGIYSNKIFARFIDSPNKHLITWEKGYRRDGWPPERESQGSMVVQRVRNYLADKRTYRFEWIDEAWPKNPQLRRMIVRATNPEGKQVEVSILCDDFARPAKEIVWLMFDRWVQENDFKYMDAHFGINEITSYRSETYASIRNELEDREVKNAAYTALENERAEQEERLGKLLLIDHKSKKQEQQRAQRIARLESPASLGPSHRRELGRMRGAQGSALKHRKQRDQQMSSIEQEIARLDGQLAVTAKNVSRLDTLIQRGSVRLCGERKYLMDVIKITARNLFYEMLAPFKDAYDNFRDDHVWFRHLSHSGGVIVPAGPELLRSHLIGTADFPKPVRAVIRQVLTKFNEIRPRLPDGSQRSIELVLGSKAAIQLAPTIA